ncbi:MAG: hypothetical protein V1870_04050 [Candidatus Aenigmatarchaeota archaeon]
MYYKMTPKQKEGWKVLGTLGLMGCSILLYALLVVAPRSEAEKKYSLGLREKTYGVIDRNNDRTIQVDELSRFLHDIGYAGHLEQNRVYTLWPTYGHEETEIKFFEDGFSGETTVQVPGDMVEKYLETHEIRK